MYRIFSVSSALLYTTKATTNMHITFLEDDEAQASLLTTWLQEQGHEVNSHQSCTQFLQGFRNDLADIIILDWELPDGTGIDVLRKIREKHNSKTPVVFITQRDSEEDIVEALKNGADDFLGKPVRKAELNARIDALARRAGLDVKHQDPTFGHYCFKDSEQSVTVDDKVIKLTQKDFMLARCLFENLGKALSRDYLLKHIWGLNGDLDTRTVDVHISRIRRSLKLQPENGYIIRTIFQFGYRLERIAI